LAVSRPFDKEYRRGMASRLVLLTTGEIALDTVRRALDPELFDVAEIDAERGEFPLELEIEGMRFEIDAVPVPPLHAWYFEQARWEPGERARAESAGFALSIEADLEEPPLKTFGRELAVASAIGGASLAALLDESAARLLSPSELRRLAAGKLAPRDLFSIHSVGREGKDAYWVHTHGLARARVPDLDLLSVPASGREAAAELIDATAALFLAHGVPPRAAPFPVGEGLELVLLPLSEALARSPASEPGGRESRDEEHREQERLVLAPASARGGGSPGIASLLPRVSRAVLFRSADDTERMRLAARSSWPDFERLFSAHQKESGWTFRVKLGYEPDRARDRPESVAREHLWFRVKSVEPGRVLATLESRPVDIASLKPSEEKWHDLGRLTDWLVSGPSGEVGPRP
jgi:hypothetical protein